MREGKEGMGKWRNEWEKWGICVIGLRGMDAPAQKRAVQVRPSPGPMKHIAPSSLVHPTYTPLLVVPPHRFS